MVMAHRHHLGSSFVDFAVDHALGILPHAGVAHRLRVKVVFDEILRLNKFGRARARQQIAIGISGMPHAHMPEGVDDAFMGDNTVGKGELGAGVLKCIGH